MRRVLSYVALTLLLSAPAYGGQASGDDPPPVKVSYGEEGLTFESADGRFGVYVTLRAQFRWSYPLDDEPITPGKFADPDNAEFAIRRARVKFGGHASGLRSSTGWHFSFESDSGSPSTTRAP